MIEHRLLGRSGLMVSGLALGTGTFGGTTPSYQRWGEVDMAEAQRMVDLCMERGVNLFDTADVYSAGRSEEILGAVLKTHGNRALVSTKVFAPTGAGPNDRGTSRHHIMAACEASLRRLGRDHIDIYFAHGFDALTPVEETLRAFDDLVRAGKIRYVGASNFSGWHLMKSLATSERDGLNRYVVHQSYYSLLGRELEWELMPLCLDQQVATMVWSPLGWGRLTGKIARGEPDGSGRIAAGGAVGGPPVDEARLHDTVDALRDVATECDATIPQVAIAWVLSRPSVSTVTLGARSGAQLSELLGSAELRLTAFQTDRLDAVSQREPIYPYWHQKQFDVRNPKPTRW